MFASIILILISLAVVNLITNLYFKKFVQVYTKFGYYSILLMINGPLFLSLSWMTGVWIRKFSSYDMSDTIKGIGGQEYGLDFDVYPEASLIKTANSLIILIGAAFFAQRFNTTPGLHYAPAVNYFDKNHKISFLSTKRILMISIIVFGFYFSSTGFEILFAADLNRFDDSLTRAEANGLRIGFVGSLVLAVLNSIKIYSSGVRIENVLLQLIFAVPSIVSASRGSTLVFTVFAVMVLLRQKNLHRAILMPIFLVAFAYIYFTPLIQRGASDIASQGGLISYANAFEKSLTTNPAEIAATMLINLGQGFGVLCEVISIDEVYSLKNEIPWQYFAMQLSPFPSILDGYDIEWVQYNPRVNVYTPINFVGHWFIVSKILAVLLYPLIYICGLLIVCWISSRKTLARHTMMAVFLVASSIFAAMAEQYPPRSALRFLEIGIVFSCLIGFFWRRGQVLPPIYTEKDKLTI
jgi:hypothetical protein